jgi:Tat protein translocase TatB subunit
MLNIGTGEILVILLLALLVLGPDKLPGAARTFGKVTRDVRRMTDGFQHEMREAMKAADIDVPGITSSRTGGGASTSSSPTGLHPGLGSGPRLDAGAVVINGSASDGAPTTQTEPTAPATACAVPNGSSDDGTAGPVSGAVVRADGPSASFS